MNFWKYTLGENYKGQYALLFSLTKKWDIWTTLLRVLKDVLYSPTCAATGIYIGNNNISK